MNTGLARRPLPPATLFAALVMAWSAASRLDAQSIASPAAQTLPEEFPSMSFDWNTPAIHDPPGRPPGTAEGSGPFITLRAEGRVSFPVSGEVVHSKTGFFFFFPYEIKGTSYRDLFPTGAGFRLEAALSWEHPDRSHPNLTADGGYFIRLGYDTFGGRRASDDFGNFFYPNDFRATTAMVGVQFGGRSEGGFFGDARVGLGAVHYDAVRATFSVGGAPSTSGEFLADTVEIASELGLKVGYRSGQMEVSLGMDFQFMAGPDRGRDVSDVVKPDSVVMFGLLIGLGFRF